MQCFGGDCYALAFGVPAALMVIALGEGPQFSGNFRWKNGRNLGRIGNPKWIVFVKPTVLSRHVYLANSWSFILKSQYVMIVH